MKRLIFTSVVAMLLLAPIVFAQPADIKTEMQQLEQQSTHNQTATTTMQPTSVPARQTKTTQNVRTESNSPQVQQPQTLGELQSKIQSIENQLKENQPWAQWFAWWWKIDLIVGLLWLFVWIFVGWQWTHFKFWGFGWPWPWWFWIPIFWLIPWFIIGWFWWPFWWFGWFWIWFWWPWIFWPIWWIILFKEAMIWHWRRRKQVATE